MEHLGIFLAGSAVILILILTCWYYKYKRYRVDEGEYISDSQMYTILVEERKKEFNNDYSLI